MNIATFKNRLIRILLLLVLLLPTAVYSQINTEAIRKAELDEGISNSIFLSLEYKTGNTNMLDLKAAYRLDILYGIFHSFLVTSIEYELANGVLANSNGFIHLRGIWSVHSIWFIECFAQSEYDKFISLKNRNLAGGGLRIETLSDATIGNDVVMDLSFGVGAMYEYEKYDSIVDIVFHKAKSTNYFNIGFKFSDYVYIANTTYYQFSLTDPGDFRILSDLVLTTTIYKYISFQNTLTFRYENAPVVASVKYDVGVISGLGIKF